MARTRFASQPIWSKDGLDTALAPLRKGRRAVPPLKTWEDRNTLNQISALPYPLLGPERRVPVRTGADGVEDRGGEGEHFTPASGPNYTARFVIMRRCCDQKWRRDWLPAPVHL